MSPNPYLELERACDRIAQRRPAWPLRLGIEGISTIAHVVAMVRNEHPTACMSDGVIRALVAVGERDALTVLLHGLSGPLLDRLSPVATEDYRAARLVPTSRGRALLYVGLIVVVVIGVLVVKGLVSH